MRFGFRRLGTAALFALAAYVAFRAAVLSSKEALGPDGGFYVTHSWLVQEGQLPYRDFFFWHTPGILFLQRVYSRVLGETHAGFATEIWLQYVLTLGLFLFVVRRFFAASIATCLFCVAVFLGSISPLEGFYFVLEPHVNVFAWLSIALALVGAEKGEQADVRGVWPWPLAAGLAAGMAFWTKQNGAAVLPLVMAIPSLSRGRPLVRPLAWTAAAFAMIPVVFFALHADAAAPAVRSFVELASYGANRGRFPVSDTWEALRAWNWLIPLFPLGAAAALFLVKRGGFEDRRLGRLALGMCAAGCLLLLPSFLRPYRHYLLLPLPFALLAVVVVLRGLARLPRRLAVAAGLAATVLTLGFVRRPLPALRRVLVPNFQTPTSRERDERIAAFIARYAGPSAQICVLPDSPQYYVYLQKRGDESTYWFSPAGADVRRALENRVPAFIVDSGDVGVARYERLLQQEGYRLVERFKTASAWLPGDLKMQGGDR